MWLKRIETEMSFVVAGRRCSVVLLHATFATYGRKTFWQPNTKLRKPAIPFTESSSLVFTEQHKDLPRKIQSFWRATLNDKRMPHRSTRRSTIMRVPPHYTAYLRLHYTLSTGAAVRGVLPSTNRYRSASLCNKLAPYSYTVRISCFGLAA
jgi:hypothetical protein